MRAKLRTKKYSVT